MRVTCYFNNEPVVVDVVDIFRFNFCSCILGYAISMLEHQEGSDDEWQDDETELDSDSLILGPELGRGAFGVGKCCSSIFDPPKEK